MMLMTLGRRAMSSPSHAQGFTPAGLLPLWDLLTQQLSHLSSLSTSKAAAGQQRPFTATTAEAAAQWAAAAGATHAAAQPSSLDSSLQPSSSLHGRMHAALQRQEYLEVLRLLPRRLPCSTHDQRLKTAEVFDCALRACAALGDGSQALRLSQLMLRLGVPLGTVGRTAVLQALCGQGQRQAALKYLRRVPSKRLQPGMFAHVLHACVDAGDLETARQCLELLQQRSTVQPSPALWSELLRYHAAVGDAAAVARTWEAAGAASQASGDSKAAMLEAAWIGALARLQQLEQALQAIEGMMDRHASLLPVELATPSSSSTSSSTGNAAATRHAGQRQQHQQPPLTPVHFMRQACNALLLAAERAGQRGVVRKLMTLMTMRGLTPDTTTYNILLRSALEHGDGLPAVLEGIEEMRRLGLTPNLHTHLALVTAHGLAGDAAGAQAAFAAIQSGPGRPPRAAFHVLASALGTAGDLEGLGQLLPRMQAAGLAPDSSTYAACFSAVRAWGRAEAQQRPLAEEPHATVSNALRFQRRLAAALLHQWTASMREQGLQHTAQTLEPLLAAYGYAGQAREAARLMAEAFGPGGSREQGAGAPAAAAAAAAGGDAGEDAEVAENAGGGRSSSSSDGGIQQSAAAEAQQQQQQQGNAVARTAAGAGRQLAPSVRLFNTAIAACTRTGRLQPALALLRQMQALGLQPDVRTFTSLIAGCAYGRQAARARALFNQMQQLRIEPSLWTYNALLKVECFCGSMEGALELVAEMHQRGLTPDTVTWATLLSSGRRLGRDDVVALAQRQLSGEGGPTYGLLGEDEAPAPTAAEAAAAALAGLESPQQAEEEGGMSNHQEHNDHRWHGPYDIDDEDEW